MKNDFANLFDAATKKNFLGVSVDLRRIHTSLHIVYSPSGWFHFKNGTRDFRNSPPFERSACFI